MSLLSVTVKKARFVGVQAQQFNTYVTLKLQNVKSTTVTVKGANPCWEQDFLFETNDVNTGLLVEVWSKGMLWDRALGYHYIPLPGVSYSSEDDSGQWVSLDSELEMLGSEVVGTKAPTGHTLLIVCRFELPFDPENTEAADLQRKLEMLNNTMDQEARAEQARRQILYNIGHSGYSEDSDYTSDLNYPVGGQGANSSASQFRTAANQLATPQRSLETSRENSYERDDHQIPATVGGRLAASSYGYSGRGHSPRYDEPYPGEGPPQRYSTQQSAESSEPLFYNSRPRHYKEYRRRKHTWDYEDSQDGWYSEGYDYPGTRVDETRIYSDTEYYPSTTTSMSSRRRGGAHRRPSLERQTTLYDEHMQYGTDGYFSDSKVGKINATYPESHTDIRHSDYYDSITGYVYQNERYGQDDEDRQWDSGGKWYLGSSIYNENKRNRKTLPQRPASSIGIHRPEYRPTVTRQRSYESEELDYSSQSTRRRKALQPQLRPISRLEGGTGKKLPPTPTKPSNVVIGRKPASLPATPGRQLPRTRTPSEESYYKQDYNEDYNYAYRSSQDNLPQDTSYVDVAYEMEPVVGNESVVKSRSYVAAATKDIYSGTVRVQDNQFEPMNYGTSQLDDHKHYIADAYAKEASNQQNEYESGQSYRDNTYTDDYDNSRQSYVPPTSQIYQSTNYQTNTYPNVSETCLENYDKSSRLTSNDNVYRTELGYNKNNIVDYNQETCKHDSYQDKHKHDSYNDENYHETYKHNDYDESYKQELYRDSYQESFDDSYKQDSSLNESYKQDSFADSYKHETATATTTTTTTAATTTAAATTAGTYDNNYKRETYQDTYQQDAFMESYKQDSYTNSYKDQDIYRESGFNETYEQETYRDDYQQDNAEYNGYNSAMVQTSVYDNQVSTSTAYEETLPSTTPYDQQQQQQQQYSQNQYDNKYNVISSGYEQSYTDSQVIQVSHDNYLEPYSNESQKSSEQQKQDDVYQDNYNVPYTKENERNDYDENYPDYSDHYTDRNYQETYRDSYDQRYTSNKETNVERRTSEVPELSVTTPRGQTRTNGYQSSESEHFYPSQDQEKEQITVSAIGSSRRKKLTGKRDASPLLQQNTDSLESRDDELKDSFETAVSSVGSSQPRKGYSEYSTAGESSPVPGTLVDSTLSTSQISATLSNHVTANARVTITAMVHGGTATLNGKRPLERADSYAEDTIDDEESYPEIVPREIHRKDSQLSHHTQLSQQSNHSQKPKLIRGDSYTSDHYNSEDGYPPAGRRDSFVQLARNDSYASINQDGSYKESLGRTDSYQKRDITRGSRYGQNFTTPQPISRAESCQRGYFKDQDSMDEADIVLSSAINGEYKMRDETLERYERGEEALNRGSRENSLVEPYKGTPPLSISDSPRGSITKQASLDESVQMDTPPRSPPEPPPDEELLDMVGAAPVPTQLKERTEMTARQRWHWAYNKIIMQLNVSRKIFSITRFVAERTMVYGESFFVIHYAQCFAAMESNIFLFIVHNSEK